MSSEQQCGAGLDERAQITLGPPLQAKVWMSSPHMSGRELELVQEAFQSNFVAPLGPMVDRFEAVLAADTGIAHVAALSSGTGAIHLGLRLSDVQQGDEIWGSSLTFIGGAAPIFYEKAIPVLFDCDENGLIDLDLVEEALAAANRVGRLPKVLITTDLYGNVVDLERASAICRRYGVILIADSAEAVGSKLNGRAAGNGADFAAYSFNGNKIITTSGGGALASDNKVMIERARFLATQARDPAPYYQHTTFGYNYRMSNICAAIGVGQMEVLSQRVARRRAIFQQYQSALARTKDVSFLPEPQGGVANRWLSVLFIRRQSKVTPSQVMATLAAHDIECRPVWKPMHLQPVFKDARYVGGSRAADMFERGICLPSGSNMLDEDLARVIQLLCAAIQ
jgi:pyridoxal phosphate-dependent aminotransferase EpsN